MTARVLDPARAALLVIDMQEAFRPVVHEFDRIAANVVTLVEGARALELPVLVTEQYPRGLGRTVPEVAEHLDGLRPPAANGAEEAAPMRPFEKTCFSACDEEGFDLGERDQALLCGIESHVCVSQTAHGLLDRGLEVHVASDAVSSRTPENRQVGLHKMEAAGAVLTSVEAALFELLGAAGGEAFKRIQRLVK